MRLPASARKNLSKGTVVFLLIILALELSLAVRRETQTWDEACHIFAGYSYWTRGDFAMNPEHPPLVKLLATLPLLSMALKVPPREKLFSKEEDFISARNFVYSNDAESILFRTRMMAALLTLALAVLVFLAAREMFGFAPALLALTLFVFEPNVLAHGALVTTDMGLSCFLFAMVYAFYRYLKIPSSFRLVSVGIAAGLALAAKHSGILIFPILIALAFCQLWTTRWHAYSKASNSPGARRLAGPLVAIALMAVLTLWASYGFHFRPRPGADAAAQVSEYSARLNSSLQKQLITKFARWHLLPESYLYGLADVGITAGFSPTYLFGKVYPHGQWFYFPAAFLIKSTITLMMFLLLLPFAIVLRGAKYRRELWFLAIPPALYFAVAITSGMNIGVRHILPIYSFLIVLAGWAAAQFVRHRRRWAWIAAFIMAFGVVSSLRAFPTYIAYSNELWGGPANTYKYLSDSNVDWGQQLKSVKAYLDHRHVKNCWFAYFGEVVIDPKYYGIPCQPLTTISTVWLQPSIEVPASIDGPVLISAGVLSGYEFGPGALNPYDQFQRLAPSAVLEHGVFVYDGRFAVPLASALNHVTQAQLLGQSGHLDEALVEAQTAVALAPNSVNTQTQLGIILARLNRQDDARKAFQQALTQATTVHPEMQSDWVPGLRNALK